MNNWWGYATVNTLPQAPHTAKKKTTTEQLRNDDGDNEKLLILVRGFWGEAFLNGVKDSPFFWGKYFPSFPSIK